MRQRLAVSEAAVTRDSRFLSVVPALVVGVMMLAPARAAAQTTGAAPSTDHRQLLSTNPFGLIIQWFNLAYDHRMTPSTTWGVSAAKVVGFGDDVDYASGAGTIRYYPAGVALRGFYIGGRGAVYHISDGIDSGNYFGAGFEIGYDWLLGSRQNVGLSLGLGATRLFGGGLDGAPVVIPALRLLNVGIAF